MAGLKKMKLESFDPSQDTMDVQVADRDGNPETVHEVYAGIPSKSGGAYNIVIRTKSKKLIAALEAGCEVYGYMFKDENAPSPTAWRLNAMAKDNEHLVPKGNFGGQAPTQAPPSQAPQQAPRPHAQKDKGMTVGCAMHCVSRLVSAGIVRYEDIENEVARWVSMSEKVTEQFS